MCGEKMSTEAMVQRINEVIKGLTSIKGKEILEWGSPEDWSVGISIGLLNDYKEIVLNKEEETIRNNNLKDNMQKILSSKCRGECFNKDTEVNENTINILKETTINVTGEFLKSEIETTTKALYDDNITIDDKTMDILINKVLDDDELWNDFHFNLREIIEDHFE